MLRLSLFLILYATAAFTQTADRTPSHCLAVAQNTPGVAYLHQASYTQASHTQAGFNLAAHDPAIRELTGNDQHNVHPASFREPVPQDRVRLTYVTHASFLIQAQGGTSAVTDYNGFIGVADFIPDVVTMNKAHVTHWTAAPDPAIPHVLPGWGDVPGEGIKHHLDLGDMVIRNVSTDIVSPYIGAKEARGNSIFVFEAAGLCIGHLGHLHHVPTDAQFAALGRVDVVMAPVDGGFTMPIDQMISVVKRLRSSIVIPMHWFDDGGLYRFLRGMEEEFAIVEVGGNTLMVSQDMLPSQPTVMVMMPNFLRDTTD